MGLNTAYIKGTIDSKFDIKSYKELLGILLDKVDFYETEVEQINNKGVKEFINLGTYVDKEDNQINLFVVKAEKEADKNKSMMRNFINKKMGMDCENALVAIYSDVSEKWKLSLIKTERYEANEESEDKLILRPSKVYSYTLGKGEALTTVLDRFESLEVISNPTLALIENAFSVQALDDKFFKEYSEKHFQLVNILEGISKFTEEAEIGKFTADEFSKKLMSQIVFLYFVQKKGYLGIGKNTGDKEFIRTMFNKAVDSNKNFFNEYLEPLFEEALNTKRDKSNYYERLDCTVPFLNGGLFETIRGYDLGESKITVSNDYFSNSRGDGLLDIFDRYNFTVSEGDEQESEVAVNPEMLGKVFESLLDTETSKKNGVVYTPRQIVQYMCKESLIQYLSNEISVVNKKVIETLILHGDRVIHEDNENLTGEYIDAKKLLRDASDTIIDTLYKVKVAEPSVGSGAFLVGMLQEIVNTIELLNDFREEPDKRIYNIKSSVIENCLYAVDVEPTAVEITKLRLWLSLLVDEGEDVKPLPNLDFKIMCGNSVVNTFNGIVLDDNEIKNQYKEIKEEAKKLPMNSPYKKEINKQKAELEEAINDFEKIVEEKENMFNEHNHDIKEEKINAVNNLRAKMFKSALKVKNTQKLNKAVENIMKMLAINTPKLGQVKEILDKVVVSDSPEFVTEKITELVGLGNGKAENCNKIIPQIYSLISEHKSDEDIDEIANKYKELSSGKNSEFFMWKSEFKEVFKEDKEGRKGFDIVIGNPPYVSSTNTDSGLKDLLEERFSTYSKKADLMIAFMELGFGELLKEKGVMAFITSNKWLRAGYGEAFRQYLVDNVDVINLIDFKGNKIFENAGVDTCILVGTKEKVEQTWGYTDGSNWK